MKRQIIVQKVDFSRDDWETIEKRSKEIVKVCPCGTSVIAVPYTWGVKIVDENTIFIEMGLSSDFDMTAMIIDRIKEDIGEDYNVLYNACKIDILDIGDTESKSDMVDEDYISAIQDVTRESSRVVGNSLKAIKTRIQKTEGIDKLWEKAGESSEALEDIAKKWKSLSEDEQYHLSVAISGRFQAARFAILMHQLSEREE